MGSTEIWTLKRVRIIDPLIEKTAASLAELDAIHFVRITDTSIQASSELEESKRRIPVSKPFHPTAVGIHLVFDFDLKSMEFHEITSAIQGWGGRMVRASLKHLPPEWDAVLVFDWSNGFWDAMEKRYSHVRWMKL